MTRSTTETKTRAGAAARVLSTLCAAGVMCMSSAVATAQNGDAAAPAAKVPPPLFDVTVEHDLPDAKATFEEVRKLMLDNYYTSTLTEDALYWAAIKGMLRHVSPPDNPELGAIWTPEQWARISQSLQGVQISLGFKSQYNPGDGSLTIAEILEGSPSEGLLQPLDRVLRIDGKPLKGLNGEEINKLILGEPGSEATLTIVRDIKVFEIKIKRQPFKISSVESFIFGAQPGNQIGYIRLKTETQGIAEEVKAELQRLADRKVDRLVLDFRENGGGVFGEALKLAELFLPKNSIILRTVQHGDKLQNVASNNETPFVFKVAVLINEHTASSSEIVTAALQDHAPGMRQRSGGAANAIVVGSKSFGKGVFEKTFELPNKYHVKFIIGAMYSPSGRSWQSHGLTPDINVDQDSKIMPALFNLPPDQRLTKDAVLLTAVRWLTSMD
ncbi:MAG: hypothetical protein GC159_22610 [Phycisphaera sp.]|nr:hypothetical protein [Phycisphaera sp.]